MKTTNFLSVLIASAALIVGATGCAHHPYGSTPIPNPNPPPAPAPAPAPDTGANANPPPGATVTDKPVVSGDTIPEGTNGPWTSVFKDGIEDREKFKADTVYYDLDSATIKKSEDKQLEAVAEFFKKNPEDALRVEGNCDERGTEKYNLALGERRALAVREYLVHLGLDSRQIMTVTFGAGKPAEPGHDEAAWKKNRRGDLVLLTPKK